MTRDLIPELILRNPVAGAAMLRDVFGFEGERDELLTFGRQRLILTGGEPDGPRGAIDHLALSVPDVDAALAGCLARGARLAGNTPDGASDIPEFGASGMRYVFLEGPEGALIELIAPLAPEPAHARGHDHIGLACADLDATRAAFIGLGLTERASVTLDRPGGPIAVSFLAWGNGVIEAYSTPEARAGTGPSARGPWRLRAESLGPVAGPDGLEILPL